MEKLSLREAYALLEVKPGISTDDLKKAWRIQIKKHHPDRYPEHERVKQTELTTKINEAYDLIEKAGLTGTKTFFNNSQQAQYDNMKQSNLNVDDYWVDKSGVRYKITELSTMRLSAIKRMIENASGLHSANVSSPQYKNICAELNKRTATMDNGKVKIIF